ncbi:MAG: T9SS type A sorting domain-containing protein [Bacteroidota bacterium]|nr:T9SS type A sorting domain-containing protein [Bacteroidota bacterium]
MRVFTLIIGFLLSQQIINAQKENSIWYFGGDYGNPNLPGTGLDFNSGNPIVLNNSQMGYTEGSAVQCSGNGNLLFYTNGEKIWDKTHTIMPNGNNLGGGVSSQQSVLIIPFPNDTTKFYLFANAGYPTSTGAGLFYSVVDLALNNGNGDITSIKKVPMLSQTSEWLTGTWHSNGTDYWVITSDYDSCIFYSYNISNSGISSPVKTNLGFNKLAKLSTIEFSNKGDKMTFSTVGNSSNIATRMIANFDQSNGNIFNPIYIDSVTNQGACFSPDDNLFYYFGYLKSGNNAELLYQCDLNSANIANSKQLLSSIYMGLHVGMKLGPNGKIYTSNVNSDSIGCINNPNQIGIGCNFVNKSIFLNGKLSGVVLPNRTFGKHIKPLTIVENKSETIISITPNPFDLDFIVNSSKQLKGFELYNSLGIKIIESTFSNFFESRNVTVNSTPGIYFLILYDQSDNSYRKTIIKK